MKKLLLLLLLCVPAMAFGQQMLQGGVVQQVKVDQARNAAFQTIPNHINASAFYPADPDFALHAQAKARNQSCLPDRRLAFFSDGGYAVSFFGSNFATYYTATGRTDRIRQNSKPYVPDPYIDPSRYPITFGEFQYPSGTLVRIGFAAAALEDYTFYPNGNFYFYCLRDTCYWPNGNISSHRVITSACLNTNVQINPH